LSVAPVEVVPSPLNLKDPREIATIELTGLERWFLPKLKDARDTVIVRRMLMTTALVVPGTLMLYALPTWVCAIIGIPYMAVLFTQGMGKYILMLHTTSHRQLFKNEHVWLNRWIPIFLAPFFGQTPYSYYVHHIGMHHPEDNLEGDLSSTMAYQRDSLLHWLHYAFKFQLIGLPLLLRYLYTKNRKKLLYSLIAGEVGWMVIAITLMVLAPVPTLFAFVIPLVLIRFLMMMGNWGQHALVDPADPENNWKSTVILVNTAYNRKCYNDGYHIVHHLAPSIHWTEMPAWFETRIAEAVKNDAIVLDMENFGSFQSIWRCLMFGRYDLLADRIVPLPGQERTKDEWIALIRTRLVPIARPGK
jgi:fatty acid desaturase